MIMMMMEMMMILWRRRMEMAYQLVSQLLLVRDGGEGADDEAKQGRVAHHLQVFSCWLMRMNCACFLLKGSIVYEYFRKISQSIS